ncbi:hypothetical protein FP744_10005647 [Trichoderma asperellum]|nr:hypothetical protein LI328DRAFT_147634 [Trichoderma asperelloides]
MGSDFNTRAPWKRSACDRCRFQKLRCYRDEGRSSGACNRCIKSGIKCVTGMTRPTGRPPARQTTMIDPNELVTPPKTSDASPADRNINRGDVGIVNLEFDFSLESVLERIGIQQTDLTLSNDLDDICSFSPPLTSLPSTPPVADMSQHARGDLDSSTQSTGALYQFSNCLLMPQAGPTDPGLPAYNTDRVEILLSKLHLDLCNQLLYVQSASWDVQDALRFTLSLESSGSHDGEMGKEHPLVSVARASRELERLLASLRLSTGLVEHTPLTMSYHPGPPPLCTTQLLVALTCYLQIVSINDSIFTAVIEYLASGGPPTPLTPLPSSHYQTSTPTLYLGGLPVLPSWKLCGTLLVHQIEYQLERIETLFGLPEHCRVSSKPGDDSKDVVTGLFAGQQSQSLLNAVFRPGEDHTRCVRSLKSKMRQMKDL